MNIQYKREEYFTKIAEFNLGSKNEREKLIKTFMDLYENKFIHRFVINDRCVNSSGSTIFNTKNSSNCFDVDDVEDSKYIVSVAGVRSSMDLYHIGWNTELLYEAHGGRGYYDSKFCHHCVDNTNIIYSDSCYNSKNLFGCISIKKGEYMILNKKYSKEEYFSLQDRIMEHMKKTEEYGEFFPPQISPICYNETQGQYYMPETKESILKKGWQWEEKIPGVFGKETIGFEKLPDDIENIDGEITKEVLRCIDCAKNYNISINEFSFYEQEKIPIPHKCPECRHMRRFKLRLPRKLWHRKCMKPNCTNEFETSYAPERSEIVYCERCYQQEVY
jgi:hypothetical protein